MTRNRSALGLVALSVLVAACSAGGNTKEPEGTSTTAPGRAVTATVVSQNDELGVPSFMWLSGGERPAGGLSVANTESVAYKTVRSLAKYFRLQGKGIDTVRLASTHDVGKGAIIARFSQRVNDVDVFRAGLNIAMTRDLLPVAATGSLAPHVRPKTQGTFKLAHEAAVQAAVSKATGKALTLKNIAPANVRETDSDYRSFDVEVPALGGVNTALASHPRVKKVWYPTATALVAAYYVEVDRLLTEGTDSELVSYVVSADNGKILFEHVMTQNDAVVSYRVWADPVTLRPLPGPQGQAAIPYPLERPTGLAVTYVQPSRVTLNNFPFSKNDPWLPAGAQTLTGNNADAYADLVAPDGFNDGDLRPNATSDNSWDRTYHPEEGPQDSQDNEKAITTHLFYVANYLHDYYYDFGFDEKSGNAQVDNFGRGGKGGDPLKLEAQDYLGRNNANMSTPADGKSPRMQMYIFDGPSNAKVKVGTAALSASVAGFTDATFSLTGSAVIAQDATAPATDGCEAITNTAEIAGKIAVIDRGFCPFVQKVTNATTAGAIGVIIINNQGDTAPSLGGTSPAHTIPVLGLSLADGNALKTQLTSGAVTLSLVRNKSIDRDGSIDSGIPEHEWGHYLSNRLIGDANGLTGAQGTGMGEGWADFSALMALVREEYGHSPQNPHWNGVFPAAGFAMADPSGGAWYYGLRRMPYSADMTKNSLTFKHIQDGTPLATTAPLSFGADGATNSEVHNTGEVWATMLWECYSALLRDGKYSFQEANDRMRGYFVASLKLTPNAPTFIDARDAVLAAAYAADAYDFKLFADAFAKRGAGTGAKAPEGAAAGNVGVSESFIAGNDFEIVSATLDDAAVSCDKDGILDNGETGTLTVQIRNDGIGTLTQTTGSVAASIEGVSFPNGNAFKLGPMKPYEVVTAQVQVKMDAGKAMQPFGVIVSMTDPTLAQVRTITTTVNTTANVDYAPNADTVDDVEAPASPWKADGNKALDTALTWSRKSDGLNHLWFMRANEEPSDQWLVSPALKVGTTDAFTLTMKHRFSFETNTGKNFDGGVIEISTDDGATWKDAGDSVYTGTLEAGDATTPSDNPLAGRKAFAGKSEGYPELTTLTLDFGKAYQGKSVLVRFRAGSDSGTAFVGWEMDDIRFTGIDNTPFTKLVPNTCDLNVTGPVIPGGTAGGDGTSSTVDPTEPGPGSIVQKFQSNDKGCNTSPSAPGAFGWLAAIGAMFAMRRRSAKR